MDTRYDDPVCRSRVAALYLPLISIVIEALPQFYGYGSEETSGFTPDVAMAIATSSIVGMEEHNLSLQVIFCPVLFCFHPPPPPLPPAPIQFLEGLKAELKNSTERVPSFSPVIFDLNTNFIDIKKMTLIELDQSQNTTGKNKPKLISSPIFKDRSFSKGYR